MNDVVVAAASVAHVAVGCDRVNIGAGRDFGTMAYGGGGQRSADRAHPADRDVPVSGTTTQQVVQKTHILRKRLLVGTRERTDQRVGRHYPAHEVVAHRISDRVPDRSADERLPRGVRFGAATGHVPARLRASAQWFGERRPQRLGDQSTASVEVGEARFVGSGADGPESALRPDEQAFASASGRIGGVGGIVAPHQLNARAEVLEDLCRQQTDQIRVARQPRVDAVERVRRHRSTADVVQPLQEQHSASAPRQIPGGDQAVVPAADDDCVERSASHRGIGPSEVTRHDAGSMVANFRTREYPGRRGYRSQRSRMRTGRCPPRRTAAVDHPSVTRYSQIVDCRSQGPPNGHALN